MRLLSAAPRLLQQDRVMDATSTKPVNNVVGVCDRNWARILRSHARQTATLILLSFLASPQIVKR